GRDAGVNRPRADTVDRHTTPPQLDGEGPGQADHSVLAGRIWADPGGGAKTLRGGDIDDAPAPAPEQVRQAGADQIDLRRQIDGEGASPERLIALGLDEDSPAHARIVDQDAEAAVAVDDARHRGGDPGLVAHVQIPRVRAASRTRDLLGHAARAVGVAVDHGDVS